MRRIDYLLDHLTMYRLVLYLLELYVVVAFVESFFGILPFTPFALLSTTALFIIVCVVVNKLLAKIFNAQTNVESSYITALILALIITPVSDLKGYLFIAIIAMLAMFSKYILVYKKKHIFNPAAIAVVIAGLALSHYASWWIGTFALFPVTALGGIFLVRKLRLGDLVFTFLVMVLALSLLLTINSRGDIIFILKQMIVDSPIIFMGTIMLTEPQTLPPKNRLKIAYGALVGLLTVPQIHFGNLYIAPEMALVIGNVFTFLVSKKGRLILEFDRKIALSKNVFEFVLKSPTSLSFSPGQYMEWTLPHSFTDRRGARRYFTLASNPGHNEVRIGVKLDKDSSSYKDALMEMEKGSMISAANLSGDFVLPKKNQKVCFIAGGIGITPYASIMETLLSRKEKRDIVLLYTNSSEDEISYRDLFDRVESELGIKIIYTLTDLGNVNPSWKGRAGRINKEMIESEIPDWKDRLFYISGSKSLVDGVKNTLKEVGVTSGNVKTDYFPGYA